MLGEAFAQVPASYRRHLLVRADSAGATHTVLDWLTTQNTKRGRTVEYSIGWSIGEPERRAITTVPASAWTPAINADGGLRDGAHVTELTGLLTLTGWPPGMRVIVRRERPHPGAQLTLFEHRDGWRYTAFVTNTTIGALRGWKPATAPTPASRTASAAPKTPACADSPPASSPSTRPGAPSPRSPPT